ncbi:hypothetical protein ACWGQ5_44250 [Streptomyces sp. NPDC055722]
MTRAYTGDAGTLHARHLPAGFHLGPRAPTPVGCTGHRLSSGPALQPAARRDQSVYLDIDSKVKQVYEADKQGAEHSYTNVRDPHFQIVTLAWLRLRLPKSSSALVR